ncbi:DUF4340 domain-containing protein [Candidatus Marinimicrobia bacterium]|jgi:hypothetical protein|nr:DUF4340 domain-containing protein [Candidatus Neomarinimicrobiota bacterium]|tara:strand:+ start:16799 stop:17347 length:549 start_codon:yes stop_codon:yes gene_type:complete
MAKIKWLFIALTLIIIVFLLNTNQQSKLGSNSDQIFGIEKEDIFIIDISKADENISLLFDGQSWSIMGNDSLMVKENSINGFFNNVLNVKRTSMVSKNKNNWDKFNVGDSTGTNLVLRDFNKNILSRIIVGSSKSEWSSSNIRVNDEVEVYQTNENISWQLNTSPTYWGELPKADTTRTDSL